MAITLGFELSSSPVWFTCLLKLKMMTTKSAPINALSLKENGKNKLSGFLHIFTTVTQISGIQYYSSLCGCVKPNKSWDQQCGLLYCCFLFYFLKINKQYFFPVKLLRNKDPAAVNFHNKVKTMKKVLKWEVGIPCLVMLLQIFYSIKGNF